MKTSILASLFTSLLASAPACADFTLFQSGSVDGQFGWTARDAAGNSVNPYDQAITVDASGKKVLRMSNAVTSGAFSDQVFSATTATAAGETGSRLWNASNDVAGASDFLATIRFRSATGAAQSGLELSLAASAKQSTVRMTQLRIVDTGLGFDLRFTDMAGSSFVTKTVATGLSYTETHTIALGIDFNDGVRQQDGLLFGNDVVTISVNGMRVASGTTWEQYYYSNELTVPGSPRLQAVNSLLLRASGTAAPSTLGQGLLFSEVSVAIPAPASVALLGVAVGLRRNRRRSPAR